MNNVTLIGRLVADPDVKSGVSKAGNNYTRATFTLAVNREKDDADFIRVVAFGKQADAVEKHVHKGSKVGVTGSIRTGSYIDKDGQKHYTVDVNAVFVEFLDGRTSNSRDGGMGYDDGGFDESQAFIPFDGDIAF